MSTFYNLEPQPTASCILRTTAGDIGLELWAKQLPLTCRNFLQHCLDGYYDNTIFHRLVPNFIIQGGDPTGTGNGGESIYDGGCFSESREEGSIWPMEDRKGKNAGQNGIGFKDEFHSRIKFNRRGLLGMANEGPDTNGSQFFITLDSTPELQNKNTLFGRVIGDTIYNVTRMGEAEIGEGDRPLYPHKITGVEILVNFFTNMVKRERVASAIVPEKIFEKKKKRKAGKQLLSFADDTEYAIETSSVPKKTKFDTRIVSDFEIEPQAAPKILEVTNKIVKKPLSLKPAENAIPSEVRPKIIDKDETQKSSSPEPEQKVTSLLEQTNAQIAELKASMKRKTQIVPEYEKKKSTLESLIPKTSVRARKRLPGEHPPSDPRVLDMLKAFQQKLEQASPPHSPKPKDESSSQQDETSLANSKTMMVDEEASLCDLHFISSCQSCLKWDKILADSTEGDDQDSDLMGTRWMSHSLSFKEDKLGKDLSYRKKAEEDLVVIDPREKARSLKEEMRAKREARSSGTEREWDKFKVGKLDRSKFLTRNVAK